MTEELSKEELIELHGKEYALKFEKVQVPLRLERIFQHVDVRENDVIADVGCGSGLALGFLDKEKERISKYYGVDFSEDMLTFAELRKAKLKFDKAEFINGSIQEFSDKHAEEIDIALALDLSEHIYDKEWLEVLQAIYRGLNDCGRLYIHTPNLTFFLELMKARNLIIKQYPGHIAVRSARQNTALLEQAGFRDIEVSFIPHYNILKHLHWLSFLPIVGKYFQARLLIQAKK